VEYPFGAGRNVCVMRRARLMAPKVAGSGYQYSQPSSAALNSTLSKLFLEAYLRLCFTVKDMTPCQVSFKAGVSLLYLLIYVYGIVADIGDHAPRAHH
jgi:hypothetical protein